MALSRSLLLAPLALASAALAWPLVARDGWEDTLARDGRPVAREWTATGRFDALITASEDEVRFTTGPRWQIRASGDPRAIAQFRFLQKPEGLIVGRVHDRKERFGKLRVEITAPALRAVTVAGSGSLAIDRMTGECASLTIAGSGDSRVDSMDAGTAKLTIAGSGALSLAGRSERSHVTIAGSGGLAGASFRTHAADVTVADRARPVSARRGR